MPTSLNEFAQIYGMLALALREEADQATIRVYHKVLQAFEPEFLVMAAEDFARNGQFFPKTSEWKLAVHRKEADRRALMADHLRKLHLESPGEFVCPRCEDSGWCRLDNGVVRCDCQELRWLEVRGLRPLPELVPVKRLGS